MKQTKITDMQRHTMQVCTLHYLRTYIHELFKYLFTYIVSGNESEFLLIKKNICNIHDNKSDYINV